jgi:hypothetical protein
MKKSLVLLSFVKQRARQLKKKKSLSQSQALDEAAKESGYSNYRNYLNLLDATHKQSKFSKDSLLEKILSENDMSRKVDLALPFIQNPETLFQDLLDILKLFQHSEETLQFVCEKSNVKNEIQQYWFNDYLTGDGEAEIYGQYEHYVAKDLIVKELKYKIDGDLLCVDGEYDLTIKFGFELEDESYREKYPHFQDHLWWGDFEITIDRNKEITVVEASFSPD